VHSAGAAAAVHQAWLPWTNGKAERFNRTLLAEFAYAQPWLSNTQRLAALDSWVQHYNTRRANSALGGRPPITRLANDRQQRPGSVQLGLDVADPGAVYVGGWTDGDAVHHAGQTSSTSATTRRRTRSAFPTSGRILTRSRRRTTIGKGPARRCPVRLLLSLKCGERRAAAQSTGRRFPLPICVHESVHQTMRAMPLKSCTKSPLPEELPECDCCADLPVNS